MAAQNRHNKGRATLQEVAERAGVSPTTASLVLNGKAASRRISLAARERVSSAARALNYAPNLLVRSLRQGRTHILSFYNAVRERQANDLYVERLGSAIEVAGGECGYDILVHCNYERSPKETYEFLNGGLADGVLLFCARSDDPLLPLLRNSSLPVVLIGSRDPERMFPSVADNAAAGMKMAADAILAAGHRRIAVFTSSLDRLFDPSLRTDLLCSNLAAAGVTIRPEFIKDEMAGISKGLEDLLTDPNPPTALFCWHDYLAYELLKVCEAKGIRVPADLSVIGYDGLIWPDRSPHVVTSIHVDLADLGRKAVELLADSIHSGGNCREDEPSLTFLPGTTLGPPRD